MAEEERKVFLPPDFLTLNGFKLGKYLWERGVKPSKRKKLYLMGIRRGGVPVATAVHEYYKRRLEEEGLSKELVDYFFDLTAQGYVGIGSGNVKKDLTIRGVEYVSENLTEKDTLLLVDDVWDTGNCLTGLIKAIEKESNNRTPKLIVATILYKPLRNKSERKPDYYLYETNDWLVFYHELEELSDEELMIHRPEVYAALKGECEAEPAPLERSVKFI